MKIGCDIIKVSRIRELDNSFFNKYFTEKEIEYANKKYDKYQTLAGIFSAKESLLKALKIGIGNGLALTDIEVLHKLDGSPYYNKELLKNKNILFKEISLSISHTDENAIAYTVIE